MKKTPTLHQNAHNVNVYKVTTHIILQDSSGPYNILVQRGVVHFQYTPVCGNDDLMERPWKRPQTLRVWELLWDCRMLKRTCQCILMNSYHESCRELSMNRHSPLPIRRSRAIQLICDDEYMKIDQPGNRLFWIEQSFARLIRELCGTDYSFTPHLHQTLPVV